MAFLADPQIWLAFLTLTALEIVLGIDNIIFISVLTGRLPESDRARGRFFGLALAMVMRILLLLSLTWVMKLTDPCSPCLVRRISGRDLILLLGGVFLIAKSTQEVHNSLEGMVQDEHAAKVASFGSVLVQIGLVDIVFSLDSVITAVGLVAHVEVMIAAIMISVLIMMAAAGSICAFCRGSSDDQNARAVVPDADRRDVDCRGFRPSRAKRLHLLRDGFFVRRRVAQSARPARPAKPIKLRPAHLDDVAKTDTPVDARHLAAPRSRKLRLPQ